MVEVGYAVLPHLQRRGFGQATLAALLARVAGDPAVRTVRASISPDNLPSQRLVEPFGFVAVGEQWDDEDGLEIVYEVTNR
jgi:RimJ/RimL family protein N-acetyltransferase